MVFRPRNTPRRATPVGSPDHEKGGLPSTARRETAFFVSLRSAAFRRLRLSRAARQEADPRLSKELILFPHDVHMGFQRRRQRTKAQRRIPRRVHNSVEAKNVSRARLRHHRSVEQQIVRADNGKLVRRNAQPAQELSSGQRLAGTDERQSPQILRAHGVTRAPADCPGA